MSIEIKNIIDSYDNYCLVKCEDGSVCSIEKEFIHPDAYINYIANLRNETELNNDELIKKIQMINKIPNKGYMIGYNKIDKNGTKYLQIYKIFSWGGMVEWN